MKKKIHLINPYGTLPNEGWRKYRTNIIAELLAEKGHNVTYWISDIDHRSKTKRSNEDKIIEISENLTFRVISSLQYSGNGSLKRIQYEKHFAKKVKEKFIKDQLEADAIVVTDPALFYGQDIFELSRISKAKFFIDILDLWPEVFVTLLPKMIRKFSDLIFWPFYKMRENIYKKADGFIAVTNDYLEVAKKIAPSKPGEVVYIGIDRESFSEVQDTFKNIEKKRDEKWLIYAGTLGINYDIKTILEFAKMLESFSGNVKFIIAGDGPLKELVIETIKVQKLSKTIFLGRVDVKELNYLYSKCDLALSTYLKTSSVSMPVKAFDYLNFGLPIVNSLGRELGRLVQEKVIGLQYEPENSKSLFSQSIKLISDENLLFNMKRNALNLSREFEVKNEYRKYIDFLEKNI